MLVVYACRCFSGTNTADYRSRSEGDAAAGVAVADGTGKITTLTPMTTTPPPPLSKHIVLPSAVSDVTASVVGATQQVTLVSIIFHTETTRAKQTYRQTCDPARNFVCSVYL